MRVLSPVVARGTRGLVMMEPLEERNLLSVSVANSAVAGATAISVPVTDPTVKVTPIPVTIQAVAGTAFDGDVGMISGLSPTLLPRLQASINWGDSTASNTAGSAGKVYFDSAGILHVSGTHTYSKEGTFGVTVLVMQNPPAGSLQPTILYTINSKAIVNQNSPGGVTIRATAGVPFAGIVGMFNVPPSPLANAVMPVLSASINWGDGTMSQGVIVRQTVTTSAGTVYAYAVQGKHIYNASGNYSILVSVYQQPPVVPGPTPVPQSAGTVSPTYVILLTTIKSTAIVTPAAVVIS